MPHLICYNHFVDKNEVIILDKLKNLQAKLDKIYAKLEIEINTKKVLEELGFPIREKGCVYLIFIVKMAIEKELQPLLYESLAKTYEVTSEEVKNEIELVISKWWQRAKLLRLNGKKDFQFDLFSANKPNNENFIIWLVSMVKDRREK